MAKKKEVITVETGLQKFLFSMPALDDPLTMAVDKYSGVVQIEIADEEGLQTVAQELVGVKGLIKQLEAKKLELLGPVKEQLIKPIEKWLKPMTKTLEMAEGVRKAAISTYKREQDEMMEALRELESKNGGELTIQETLIEVEEGKISTTPKTMFEVENAPLVPEEMVRAAVLTTRGKEALREIIRARIDGGVRKIPGVRVYVDYQVSVTLE